MTTSPPLADAPSEGTMECRTGAIIQREGARAVGSTFVRAWDSEPPPLPATTPSSLRALPALPSPSAPTPPAPPVSPVAKPGSPRRYPSGSSFSRERPTYVPYSVAGAFALGASIAALAGIAVERGAVEFAALAAAVAGGMTLSAALARASKGRTERTRSR